ncbi:uroporphyrinogen-III synthase [Glaciimonas immobilis]|uniref:Uroporphyrinogen-III synthase n=1 Tax=Glaciimonas immobilis TaxID=728004 RepID=A0A840RR78_9BURK|nr:uroporphyrinogen-III synthase [Glaciimonas immobilis]KAF3998083.1 uroporphyrinogen III synthase [Glaciimonas immobilis]MBB5199224.1 uroporphyrinogen-III synthase [Glaciimonas immobilis]
MNKLRPIIITRPLAQAAVLAEKVSARGGEPVIFPLLDILPLADTAELQATLAQLNRFALVTFVSPNAIDAAFHYITQWPSAVAIGIVGEGSRVALQRHGVSSDNATIFSPPDAAKTDSEGLLQALDLPALSGRRVLIVRGESGRELLADSLRDAGVDVWSLAAYRRLPPTLTPAVAARLQELMNSQNDWIITSSEALKILIQMVQALDNTAGNGTGVVKIQQKNLLVPHARIADTAHALGFTAVTLTGSGDERLLDALQFQL